MSGKSYHQSTHKNRLPGIGVLGLALWLLFFIHPPVSAATSGASYLSLKPSGYVNDFANVLENETRTRLEYLLGSLEARSGIEIAVVTLNSMEGSSIEEAANELFMKWGVGKKGTDKGILFLTSISERKTRIEVGYGLEEAVPDSKAGRILDDYALPYFQKDDFNTGIYAASTGLVDALKQYYRINLDLTGDEKEFLEQKQTSFGTLIFYIIIFIIMSRFFGPFFFLFLLGSGRSHYSGFGSGGGGFGGGFGSGFGGFGGGSSGGGGASRSF
ncbi:MAG: TPM domain-containing protein [bacterium]|nr:TPM domain-containing protein [bacterium]